RFLIMESVRDTAPVRIASDAESIRDIIDSLQAVAKRAPFDESVADRIFREVNAALLDTQAIPTADGWVPSFPASERRRNPDGLVIVSFVVDTYGRVDPKSI